MSEKKRTTRVMRVTMDEDEFEKYDNGETHSNNGVRYDTGSLSAIPDIAPLEDGDLPTEVRYIEPEEPSFGESIIAAVGDAIIVALQDPEVQRMLFELGDNVWHHKIKPWFSKTTEKIRGKRGRAADRKTDSIVDAGAGSVVVECSEQSSAVEKQNPHKETFVVTETQAEEIISEARKKARELSALIYLLQNLCIKDELNDNERYLEQSSIRQLLSEESTNTMRLLVANPSLQLVDDETAKSFQNFLNGYISNGEKLIPIPAQKNNDDKAGKQP